MRRTAVIVMLGSAVACGGEVGNGTSMPDAAASDAAVPLDAPPCQATSQTDLAGVRIVIDMSRCVFTLAEARSGLSIGYDVIVDAAVSGVVPRPQDAGGCGPPDGSGLIPFESLAGAGQGYCVCDVGLCPGYPNRPITIVAGTFPHTFMWDGTNWNGPSDTGNPKGAPFPPGTYTLSVSAVGTLTTDGSMTPFKVKGTLPVTLVP